MRPLRPGDPAGVGPFRVLARLGAGGMGVVYLARSPSGTVAAVKVIHNARVGDEGFRARFRREAEAARGVTSRWVAPLLDADPDAREPWLATAFVPGPSLAEAVELHGPLPHPTVRVLGARLAEALEAVHRAGLVHRDVKPGNILLGVDGPRLIDFGIAHTPGGTVLTSSGVVVGSPGFLSPEQARARRAEIGPPSDVFSLGCVLAYAAAGVRPFGGGLAAAALLRTVTEEPDLDGVPAELAPLVRACLAKQPQERPDPAAVRTVLGGSRDGAGPWLPEPVIRLVADRSAQALRVTAAGTAEVPPPSPRTALPDAETVTAAPAGTGATAATTRRRFLVLGSTAGVVAAGAGALWWARTRPDPFATGDGGTRDRPVLTLAFHGDLSGGTGATGQAQRNGALIAVDHVNGQNSRPFRLRLAVHDDGGVPSRALTVAERVAADSSVRAVVGPTADACALTAVPVYQAAPLSTVAVSPDVDVRPGAPETAARQAYVLGRPDDRLMAIPCVTYVRHAPGVHRVVLFDDRTQGDLSWYLCRQIATSLREAGRTVTIRAVGRVMDAGALATEVRADRADALVFTGDEQRTAALARALASTGYTGVRMGIRQGFGTRFLRAAGAAAEGWVFTTPFVDATRVPAARAFTAAYREKFGTAPPWWAAEAYDAVLFLAEAMTHGRTPVTDRGSIVWRVRDVHYRGITRTLSHPATGGGLYDGEGLFLHRVSGGAFTFLGRHDAVGAAAAGPGSGGTEAARPSGTPSHGRREPPRGR
ncbi:bifunctional serine/threonine-protein kinase/ABC transporter substrate-binding protein [Streptomyces sp. MRC013]|uniref:bifunctional serine/threonine-protein kinase/ABC transporter substrate-binding protein n=1 Tax=Streptomyces sp. MRC013 TaxID=2898276 RepID=UPI002026AAB1|nr:bifunctional serine/threonine-protein kinase/ABC transporter substrate-binding protein [Streptomyces sp. MRC013]URM90951.1 bifunctional serine/threonine-protein kinase/ABC transporter substrate-binding protein [Streptomyces sp. MRC013]